MESMDLVMLNPSKPGAFQVKDQIMGNVIVMIVLSQMKSYAGKYVPVCLHLNTEMAITAFGMDQAFAREQECGLWISFAKGLQPLQGVC